MKSLTQQQHTKIANNLVVALKEWESKGNKISDSTLFYYCPWFTGKKDQHYKQAA